MTPTHPKFSRKTDRLSTSATTDPTADSNARNSSVPQRFPAYGAPQPFFRNTQTARPGNTRSPDQVQQADYSPLRAPCDPIPMRDASAGTPQADPGEIVALSACVSPLLAL